MCVSHDFPIADTKKILILKWKCPEPKLILSVTGGAQDFQIPSRMNRAFKEGLVKAAASTDAWIITGGTDHGVMKLVGEAVKEEAPLYYSSRNEQSINLLGVCSKEKIAGAEDFSGQSFIKDYKLTPVHEKVLLDPNHNNFILVENKELRGAFGQEIEFRLELEEFFVNEKIPLVLIVVNGGKNTLLTVNQSINKNIPILVLAVNNFDFFEMDFNKLMKT